MIYNLISIVVINMWVTKYPLRINQYQPLINRSKSNGILINPICSLHNNSINIRTIDVSKDGKEILKKK